MTPIELGNWVGTSGCSGSFVVATAPDPGDRRPQFGVLPARLTPQHLRSIKHVDVLYREADLFKHHHDGEVLSHALYTPRRWRENAHRNAEERDRARREFSRMEADLHSSQGRTFSLEAYI